MFTNNKMINFNSSEKVQASVTLMLLLIMLGIRGRVAGFDPKSLQRVEKYLRVILGLETPSYTEALQRPQHYFPGSTAKPWHEPADHEWTAVLEKGCETIKNELSHIYSREHFRFQHQGLADEGHWNVYYFYYSGRKAKDNCRRCPQTTQLINSIPEVSNSG